MSNKVTWAEIKTLVNSLPDHILTQAATIWDDAEENGHCVTKIKIL